MTFRHFLQRALVTIFAPIVVVALAIAAPAEKAAKSDTPRPEATKVDYVLQPADLIRVQIAFEEDLNREVRISQEYSVSLPLIGTVDLKGKTALQAQDTIRELYDRDYLVNPQVNLIVLEYVPRNVFVLGAVGAPGVVLFPREQGLTLLEAISKAGSFNRLADKKHVTLKRTYPDGRTETFPTINADDLTKGDSTESWPLQPNDVISVPEKIL